MISYGPVLTGILVSKKRPGTWLYDRSAPREITIKRKPATLAYSRFDYETDQIDEGRPVPQTKDGFLYFCWPANSGEHLTVEDAKKWADAQPWGPVSWSTRVLQSPTTSVSDNVGPAFAGTTKNQKLTSPIAVLRRNNRR